jgi:chromosome segregation ATPase
MMTRNQLAIRHDQALAECRRLKATLRATRAELVEALASSANVTAAANGTDEALQDCQGQVRMLESDLAAAKRDIDNLTLVASRQDTRIEKMIAQDVAATVKATRGNDTNSEGII